MVYFLGATLWRRGSLKTSRRQWHVRVGAAWEAALFSRLMVRSQFHLARFQDVQGIIDFRSFFSLVHSDQITQGNRRQDKGAAFRNADFRFHVVFKSECRSQGGCEQFFLKFSPK